ncbi:MAG: LacI family DNA-binding transcriptional regulator [Candidatus Acidiferrales bacterium]
MHEYAILSHMPVTLSDIARDLKVSAVTVSKVLRNTGKISAATHARVLKRAKELNYQTNWAARSLVTRRTYTVGLVLPEFTHSFFAEIARAVAEELRPHGYHVITSYFDEDPELERSETNALLARQVDGLIIASAQSQEGRGYFESIRKRQVPFVLIDRPVPGVHASFVGVDNEAIGKLATAHLIAQGCRRIAHLRGPDVGIARGRMTSYVQTLQRRGLAVRNSYIVQAGHDDKTGYAAMRQLLKKRPLPDGVFCYNDPVAIGAVKAILDAGLRVPNDIAVTGSGNIHFSDLLAVPLTTVDQGTRKIGKTAAEILLRQISSKRTLAPTRILIKPKLVVRQSTLRAAPQSAKLASKTRRKLRRKAK